MTIKCLDTMATEMCYDDPTIATRTLECILRGFCECAPS